VQQIPAEQQEQYRQSWLKFRISKLKEVQAIPPALAELVDVIKEEGDAAVHDDVVYEKDSAQALRNFTKAFLEQTFTLPEHIRLVRSKTRVE